MDQAHGAGVAADTGAAQPFGVSFFEIGRAIEGVVLAYAVRHDVAVLGTARHRVANRRRRRDARFRFRFRFRHRRRLARRDGVRHSVAGGVGHEAPRGDDGAQTQMRDMSRDLIRDDAFDERTIRSLLERAGGGGGFAFSRVANRRDSLFLSPLLDASSATQLLHRGLPGARQQPLRVANLGGGGVTRIGALRGRERFGGHVDAKGRGARARVERLGRPRGVRTIRRARTDGAGEATPRREPSDARVESGERREARATRRMLFRARRTRRRDWRRAKTGRARRVRGRSGSSTVGPSRGFPDVSRRFV